MAEGSTVRVRIHAALVCEARTTLGTRSNSQTVELPIALALAIRAPGGAESAKYLEIFRSDRLTV